MILTFLKGFSWFLPRLYRTGPFASSANDPIKSRFSDASQAFTYKPWFKRIFNQLIQINPFENSDGVCDGLSTQYEKSQHGVHTILTAGPHPQDATGAQAPLIFGSNTIKSVRGCGGQMLSKIDYSVNTDGSQPLSCGTDDYGPGFDAYPIQMARNQCTFSYMSGTTVSDNNGDRFLSNLYFYWKC